MSALGRSAQALGVRGGSITSWSSGYGRTASYRRITSSAQRPNKLRSPFSRLESPLASSILLRNTLEPKEILLRSSTLYARHFHSQGLLWQEAKPKNNVKPEEEEKKSEEKSEETSEEKSEKKSEEKSEDTDKDKKGEEGEKEKPPPPPPHGDKTPWQVFTETLQSEFKASKEWNESTKAISSGYEEFTQNPTLQKAKTSYSQAADAASKTTSAAGRALGKGASWTWETPVVKGVRHGVNAAGRGIEAATRPIRETEAYKSVEKVIDDGSSSRYGGWVEKEERRRKREAREAELASKYGGRPAGPMEEDPEYVFFFFFLLLLIN